MSRNSHFHCLTYLLLAVTLTELCVAFQRVPSYDYEEQASGDDEPDEKPEVLVQQTYTDFHTQLQQYIANKTVTVNGTRKHPSKHHMGSVKVDVDVEVTHVSVDQKQQTISVNGILKMAWKDYLAWWQPNQYDGVKKIVLRQWEIWTPNLKIMSSAEGFGEFFSISTTSYATLVTNYPKDTYSEVRMDIPFSIKVGCSFDYSAYPYDSQRCTLGLYPLQRASNLRLRYRRIPQTVGLSWQAWTNKPAKSLVSEWNVEDIKTEVKYLSLKKEHTKETYLDEEPADDKAYDAWSLLYIHIRLQRYTPYYGAAILLPTVISFLIPTFSFFLMSPTWAIYLLLANIFFVGMFVQDLLQMVPPAVGGLPRIGYFIGIDLCLTVLSLFVHFWFLWMMKTRGDLPNYGKNIIRMRRLMLQQLKRKGSGDEFTDRSQSIDDDLNWRTVVDTMRIIITLFFLFLLLILLLLLLI